MFPTPGGCVAAAAITKLAARAVSRAARSPPPPTPQYRFSLAFRIASGQRIASHFFSLNHPPLLALSLPLAPRALCSILLMAETLVVCRIRQHPRGSGGQFGWNYRSCEVLYKHMCVCEFRAVSAQGCDTAIWAHAGAQAGSLSDFFAPSHC